MTVSSIHSKSILVTKEDLRKFGFVFKEDVHKLDLKFENKINEIKVQMAEFESRILKWMLIFWAGQIGVIVAILEVFFKK